MLKIGLNGFGSFGRLLLRTALEKKCNVVAINEPNLSIEHMAYLLRFSTSRGRFKGRICVGENFLLINDKKFMVFAENDADKIKWSDAEVHCVIEASGHMNSAEKASAHLKGGAKKVIIAGPAPDAPILVRGVSLDSYETSMNVVTTGCSTANCMVPLIKVLHDNFSIQEGFITTIQSSQGANTPKSKTEVDPGMWRSMRADSGSILPTSMFSIRAVDKLIPELKDKIAARTLLVPIGCVSMLDLTVRLGEATNMDCVKQQLRTNSKGCLKGVLGYTEDEIISMDLANDKRSVICDGKASFALNNGFYKFVAWYDIQTGLANRVMDVIEYIHEHEEENC